MKINRKNFIRSSAAFLGTLYLNQLFAESTQKIPNSSKRKSALVIGSGLSGLYAAHLLQNSGYKVKVIEARNRIGGRIYTFQDKRSSTMGELGAEFIYGYQEHLLKLCEVLGVKIYEHSIETSMFLNGKYIPFNEVGENPRTHKILVKVTEMYTKMSDEQKEGLDKLSAANYLSYQGVDKKELFLLELKYSLYYGESLRHVSANDFIQALAKIYNKKNKIFKINGGTDSLLKAFVTHIGKQNIKVNNPVVSITQNKDKVSVKTKKGKEYKADICICTVPSSVMNQIQWSPDLTKEKKIANLQVKYGRITKIFSQFNNADWINKNWHILTDRLLQYVYATDINTSLNTGVLTLVSTGDKSDLFTSLDEWGLRTVLYSNLRNFNYNPTTSKLEQIQWVNWQHEPFIKGSYSIFSPGMYYVKEHLQKPFGRVFFAGEHIAKESGSMESCLLSVLNAVKQI
ncbi:MAG: FAD-dependent oxidoreductase [Leptospiraceae bacterium]|nr:FAD-dependent oxidoreductase [Leptospiraceae bacterium]